MNTHISTAQFQKNTNIYFLFVCLGLAIDFTQKHPEGACQLI